MCRIRLGSGARELAHSIASWVVEVKRRRKTVMRVMVVEVEIKGMMKAVVRVMAMEVKVRLVTKAKVVMVKASVMTVTAG